MGVSINWSKMLNKELDDEFRKKDEVLEEIKRIKQKDLQDNIKSA